MIAAAQYLRTSRPFEHAYLQRQQNVIAEFARVHGFTVVKTYADPARSGLLLNGRPEMQHLLRDVLQGNPQFHAILTYDISRWGRFQDPDEAAHYEFLCKSSGVPVIYCNESHVNEKTVAGALFKNMRRGQAGEFSRELGEKVFRASQRVARLGFRVGGHPGVGFRRMMVSPDGKPLQLLQQGEHKFSKRNRVTLVLGPEEEVRTVKDIFAMAASNAADCGSIADELNRCGSSYLNGRPWDYYDVRRLITNPKYIGRSIWGRTAARLKTPKRDVEHSKWIVREGVYPQIVDRDVFKRVQHLLNRRRRRPWTDEELLAKLRRLLRCKGELSDKIIEHSSIVPAMSTYRRRFGTLRKIYSMIGYKPKKGRFTRFLRRLQTESLREQLFEKIQELYPRDISLFHLPGRRRFILRLDNGLSVSVVLCRSQKLKAGHDLWKIYPTSSEREYITLMCRLTPDNHGFLDFHLFPFISKRLPYVFDESDAWFRSGQKLHDLKDLPRNAKLLSRMDDRLDDTSRLAIMMREEMMKDVDDFVAVNASSFNTIRQNSNRARNENKTNHLEPPNFRRLR